MFRKITDGLIDIMQKYLPSSFVLAIILAIIVFAAGILFTDSTPMDMFNYAGAACLNWLGFTMQMVLILNG